MILKNKKSNSDEDIKNVKLDRKTLKKEKRKNANVNKKYLKFFS